MSVIAPEAELDMGDFELDVTVIENESDDDCEQSENCQTEDGCSSTCPSACNSSS